MKKLSGLALAASLLAVSGSASADWFGDRWGNGYNDWPVWTPMYWMEEMSDSFNDNGWGGNRRYYGNPYYGNYAPYPYQGGYYAPQPYQPYPYPPQQYGYQGYAVPQSPVAPAVK